MSSCNNGRKIERVGRPINSKKHTKKVVPKKHTCKSCGCHQSDCNCNFTPVKNIAPLNSDCVLVNSVVGSKMVQKVAEVTLPIGLFAGLTLAGLISVTVTPNLEGITHNVRVIRDKVVNMGLLPAIVTVTFTIPPATTILTLSVSTSIPFQEHTDFPGACPEDIVTEAPFVIEGIFTQPGVPVVTGPVIGDLLTGILVKIVLRTTITVTRPIIVDSNGDMCDVNDRRCETSTTSPIFNFPPPNGGLV
jgi:hypothetical protein